LRGKEKSDKLHETSLTKATPPSFQKRVVPFSEWYKPQFGPRRPKEVAKRTGIARTTVVVQLNWFLKEKILKRGEGDFSKSLTESLLSILERMGRGPE